MFGEECFFLTRSSALLPRWRLQLEVPCLLSARGGFPAGTWVRGTVRAGCGKRRTLKPIFRRSGRSTGSSWRTLACTGTWMRRWIWWFHRRAIHSVWVVKAFIYYVALWFNSALARRRMRRQRGSSASRSSRLIVPLNAEGSSEYRFLPLKDQAAQIRSDSKLDVSWCRFLHKMYKTNSRDFMLHVKIQSYSVLSVLQYRFLKKKKMLVYILNDSNYSRCRRQK